MKDQISNDSYATFRVTIASGILGSLGATLGWIIWLAVRMASVKLVVTVFVGAAIGFIVHWVKHYVHVAKLEAAGESADHGEHGSGKSMRSFAALAWAGGFGFLGLASEDLVAHMAAEFLLPFLASLVTLLPAGMLIGYTMSRGRAKDEAGFMVFANGIFLGGAITVITGALWSLGWGHTPWFQLFCWWGLIGFGTRLMTSESENAVGIADPLLAVVIIFALTFVVNLAPITKSTYERFGVFGQLAANFRIMVAEVQQSPGLPATFWTQAEKNFEEERAHEIHAKAAHDEPGTPAAPPPLLNTLGKDPAQSGKNLLTGDIDLKKDLHDMNQLAMLSHLGKGNPLPPLNQLNKFALVTEEKAEEPWYRNSVIRQEYLRSWLVMLLFAIGVGVAPAVEKGLRPIDYPNSQTYRRDMTLTVVVALTIIVSCVYARQQISKSSSEAQATDLLAH